MDQNTSARAPSSKNKQYNHAFTIAFELVTVHEETTKIPEEEFYKAIRKRLRSFKDDKEGMTLSAHCGQPFDTYEVGE